MSLKKEYLIRKRFKRSLTPKEEGWEARMGDGAGNVKVAGNDDYRYVRPKHMDLPMLVRRGSAPDIEGARVWVTRGWGKKKGWRIVGVLDSDDVSTGVEPHGWTHYEDGPDPSYKTDRQITPLLVYATTGMTAHVNGGYITYHGQPLWITAVNMDMTGHIPASGARYSLIRVSNAGELSVQDGAAVGDLADLIDADIPECTADYAAIAFVRLYHGQTLLSKTTANPDVKMLVWGGGLFDAGFVILIEDLFDVSINLPVDRQVIWFDQDYDADGEWVNHTLTEDDISDLEHDAVKLQGRTLADTAPEVGEGLMWDGSQWEPGEISGGGSGDPFWWIEGAISAVPSAGMDWVAPRNCTISKVILYCRDPGSAGSTVIDVNLGGVSIFPITTKPTLAYDDADQMVEAVPDTVSVAEGEVISIDIDSAATDAEDLLDIAGGDDCINVEATPATQNGSIFSVEIWGIVPRFAPVSTTGLDSVTD